MGRTELDNDRVEFMLDKLQENPKQSGTSLLKAADQLDEQANADLKERFRKKAFSCFGWIIKSIIPTNGGFSDEDPDFSIHFKDEDPWVYEWLRRADFPVKILTPSQSVGKFHESDTFKCNRGMIFVIQMDKNISGDKFKQEFNSEIKRIGLILENLKS